jgi:hypothetical protein
MKTQIKKLLSVLTLIAILATAFYTVPVSAAELTAELTAEDFKVTLNGISEIFNEESTDVYLPFVKFQGGTSLTLVVVSRLPTSLLLATVFIIKLKPPISLLLTVLFIIKGIVKGLN